MFRLGNPMEFPTKNVSMLGRGRQPNQEVVKFANLTISLSEYTPEN